MTALLQRRAEQENYENRTVDSRLRPSTVASSVGPQASKNCTSCLRAPSSFHFRSRLTISSSLMVARVGGHLLFGFGDRAERTGLFGKIDDGLHCLDRAVLALGFGHQSEG